MKDIWDEIAHHAETAQEVCDVKENWDDYVQDILQVVEDKLKSVFPTHVKLLFGPNSIGLHFTARSTPITIGFQVDHDKYKGGVIACLDPATAKTYGLMKGTEYKKMSNGHGGYGVLIPYRQLEEEVRCIVGAFCAAHTPELLTPEMSFEIPAIGGGVGPTRSHNNPELCGEWDVQVRPRRPHQSQSKSSVQGDAEDLLERIENQGYEFFG